MYIFLILYRYMKQNDSCIETRLSLEYDFIINNITTS